MRRPRDATLSNSQCAPTHVLLRHLARKRDEVERSAKALGDKLPRDLAAVLRELPERPRRELDVERLRLLQEHEVAVLSSALARETALDRTGRRRRLHGGVCCHRSMLQRRRRA